MTRYDALVIGSGAGGATTAVHLARAGRRVLVVEEGPDLRADPPTGVLDAMATQYRRRGMTPILGPSPIGYVEGACVGGSTQINSGFWHRTPADALERWSREFDLRDADEDALRPHFEWAEQQLGVGLFEGDRPPTTRLFERGIEAMGWSAVETPRTGQASTSSVRRTPCGVGDAVLPEALERGAELLDRARAERLVVSGRRVTGAVVRRAVGGREERLQIVADAVFVCAGPTETPVLLRRSGVAPGAGATLRVHPMLKVAAEFAEPVSAEPAFLPLIQVKEFWPDISLGGAFSSPGHLAMVLSENWADNRARVPDLAHFGNYYVAVRGSGRGAVRPAPWGRPGTRLRYVLSDADGRNLSTGLARMAAALLAGGALAVYPAVQGLGPIRSAAEAATWLERPLATSRMALTTVHAFSTCPVGERTDRTVADSYGRVHGMENLYVNDASMLPDSPGVNPQGSVMALARRNVLHFIEGTDR